MAELLKHRYSRSFIEGLAKALGDAQPGFDQRGFVAAVLGSGWRGLELKQRMHRIAAVLHDFVAGDYRTQLATLQKAAPRFGGFEAMFFPDFVETYGLDDFDASIAALEHLTQFSSSEFAVRPFLARYGDRMLPVMCAWVRHPNEHVRRLASEGSRPRLPWGMRLPQFIADPAPLLPILEALKDDPSEYVRRSVANSLNDIAKDHPAVVLDIAQRWLGASAATDALVKHACRTLLKRGDARALRLFGHHARADVRVRHFALATDRLPIGADLGFSFEVALNEREPHRLRVEYAVDFVKRAGHAARKVFKIAERAFAAGQAAVFARSHRFRDFSTRKHYPGRHRIAVVVNGVQRAARSVMLTALAPTTPRARSRGRVRSASSSPR